MTERLREIALGFLPGAAATQLGISLGYPRRGAWGGVAAELWAGHRGAWAHST